MAVIYNRLHVNIYKKISCCVNKMTNAFIVDVDAMLMLPNLNIHFSLMRQKLAPLLLSQRRPKRTFIIIVYIYYNI